MARAIVLSKYMCMCICCCTRTHAVYGCNGIGWELNLLTPVDAEVHVAKEAATEYKIQDAVFESSLHELEILLREKFSMP